PAEMRARYTPGGARPPSRVVPGHRSVQRPDGRTSFEALQIERPWTSTTSNPTRERPGSSSVHAKPAALGFGYALDSASTSAVVPTSSEVFGSESMLRSMPLFDSLVSVSVPRVSATMRSVWTPMLFVGASSACTITLSCAATDVSPAARAVPLSSTAVQWVRPAGMEPRFRSANWNGVVELLYSWLGVDAVGAGCRSMFGNSWICDVSRNPPLSVTMYRTTRGMPVPSSWFSATNEADGVSNT